MATKNATTSPTSPDSSKRNDDLRTFYHSYLETCNAHNFQAAKAFYAQTVKVNDQPITPDELITPLGGLVAAFPDWRWEIRHLTIEEDFLALHFSITGTHRGEFQGIEPTGKRFSSSEFTVYHVVEGKFAEVWFQVDWETIKKQLVD